MNKTDRTHTGPYLTQQLRNANKPPVIPTTRPSLAQQGDRVYWKQSTSAEDPTLV